MTFLECGSVRAYSLRVLATDVVMGDANRIWGVVLAGGEGSRLREITTTSAGEVIPKQFCSLSSASCLLEDAIRRAKAVTLTSQICSVVAEKHRRWWGGALKSLPPQNVFVEPHNRGTAHGILLALLKIQKRAPDAVVVLLPADHYIADERALARSLRTAADLAANPSNERLVYLLGAEPERADQELGYILPSEQKEGIAAEVLLFAEKPMLGQAAELIRAGALWNTFIFAGKVQALLRLFEHRFAATIRDMRCALGLGYSDLVRPIALNLLYADLESRDFSRDVLQCRERDLRVLTITSCGWTDLGTPNRVKETTRHLADCRPHAAERFSSTARYLDLAPTQATSASHDRQSSTAA
jgi:mannose-1-phosphate guanylyltransferase